MATAICGPGSTSRDYRQNDVTPEGAQRTADVAQFYLHAAGGMHSSALGHPFVDVQRCELKPQEVAELGYRPGDPQKDMDAFMRSAEAWPFFTHEKGPPLL